MRWKRSAVVTLASIVLVTLVFAVYAWRRRWISDDGLIFVRVVRNILDGNGPVFNAFERAEANTSALWPWLLALVGTITRGDLAQVAVGTGLVCSVGGVALALDGSRRWHRSRGSTTMLVPAAIVIPVAMFPFWDYATSGLETALTTLWLATIWWLLVQLSPESSRRRQLVAAVVFGLGPLVRPDLAIASGTFLVALWAIVRPARRRTLALAGAATVLPVGYEIFRAGFYGTLVPLPALAKGATHAEWQRGVDYLYDYVAPFDLWLPFVAVVALFAVIAWRTKILRRDRVVIAAPVVAATVMGLYVLRVGGDFMYARMWLPATFLVVMPGMLLPLRRISIATIVIVCAWGVHVARKLDDHRRHITSPLIEDERGGYTKWTGDLHPIDEDPYIIAAYTVAAPIFDAVHEHRRLFMTEGGVELPLDPKRPQPIVFVAGRLGLGGVLAPLDGIAADTLGLANPIGARITQNHPEQAPGHQKVLGWAWLLADFGDPTRIAETDQKPSLVRAARHAMSCGELQELLASVREPLTAGRFLSNLVGSVHRTRLEIPPDPVDAERRFCGATAIPDVIASSSTEDWGWARENVVDGITTTMIGRRLGYSSKVWQKTDHVEWVELDYRDVQTMSKVTIYPRTDEGFVGAGFPIDFKIQTWDGHVWVDQVTKVDYPVPTGPQVFTFAVPVTTAKLRVVATKLQDIKTDGYVMQLAEIEVD
jgi:arabinofuranosyltransferase